MIMLLSELLRSLELKLDDDIHLIAFFFLNEILEKLLKRCIIRSSHAKMFIHISKRTSKTIKLCIRRWLISIVYDISIYVFIKIF